MVDKVSKGIHELKREISKTGIAQEEREQERETMNTDTLLYCTPNLQKLVYQVPRCGRKGTSE